MPTPRPNQSSGRQLPGAPPPGAFTPKPKQSHTPRDDSFTPKPQQQGYTPKPRQSHTPRDPEPKDDPSNVSSSSPRAQGLEAEENPFSSRQLSASARHVPGGGLAGMTTLEDPGTRYEDPGTRYKPMTPHLAEDRARSDPAKQAAGTVSAVGQELGGPLPVLEEDAIEDDPGAYFLPPTVEATSDGQGLPQTATAEQIGRPEKEQEEEEDLGWVAALAEEADQNSEEGDGDSEFAAPVEATPLGHIANKVVGRAHMTSCPEDDVLTSCPPPSSTGGAPSIFDAKTPFDPTSLWGDEEFKAWMKTLNMGQRMRVQERLVVRAAVERSEHAIQALSTAGDKKDTAWTSTWEAAAQWSLGWFQESEFAPYLRHFGYEVESDKKWIAVPSNSGVSLHLELNSHVQMAGHTWYQVNCQLRRTAGRGDIEWPAPRRLVQLRLDLHDRLKMSLGAEYTMLFGEARFAKYGAPPGTTARLRAWLERLANVINNAEVTPGVAAVTLAFFQAPAPEGVDQPTMGALRHAGESDSNLGGPSLTPSLQGDSNYGAGVSLRGDFL